MHIVVQIDICGIHACACSHTRYMHTYTFSFRSPFLAYMLVHIYMPTYIRRYMHTHTFWFRSPFLAYMLTCPHTFVDTCIHTHFGSDLHLYNLATAFRGTIDINTIPCHNAVVHPLCHPGCAVYAVYQGLHECMYV
jgi:hypothetical protein